MMKVNGVVTFRECPRIFIISRLVLMCTVQVIKDITTPSRLGVSKHEYKFVYISNAKIALSRGAMLQFEVPHLVQLPSELKI